MSKRTKWIKRLVPRPVRRFFEVREQSSAENIYHCCVHKTASQWVRNILQSHDTYKYSGLEVHNYEELLPQKADPRPLTARMFEAPFPKGKIITPLYIDQPGLKNIPKPKHFRAFFVMRDPRDIVISRYFSFKVSHPVIGGISKMRSELGSLSQEEGLAYVIEQLPKLDTLRALKSWATIAPGDQDLAIFRYEDLTGSDQFATWQRLLTHCDIRMPAAKLIRMLERNSFAVLTKGRERGTEDVSAHLRKGVAGDWKNYFTPAVEKKFRAVAGTLVEDLGYEW
jgi:hypothetical protein